jgi:hypothetical protein
MSSGNSKQYQVLKNITYKSIDSQNLAGDIYLPVKLGLKPDGLAVLAICLGSVKN